MIDLVDLANIQPQFGAQMLGQHRSERYRKRVVVALIYLDDGHNEINREFDSWLLHKSMCDSQCGAMVSSFGREVPEGAFQFMN